MFTGLVEEQGTVLSVEPLSDDSLRLRIAGSVVTADLAQGESICVSGVCLTAVEPDRESFAADVMRATVRRTSLADAAPGRRVNLERAMAAGDRFGGHIVSGHVDGLAEVVDRTDAPHWRVLRLRAPADLERFLAAQGSVTLDGVSLTVSSVGPDWFEVSLIPTTLAETTMGALVPGSLVNVEVDMLARYVDRILCAERGQG
ncbi:MAG: riboflavin synthase [Candidatus Nanopelagicales bacterium]